jgi:hypothetical protein
MGDGEDSIQVDRSQQLHPRSRVKFPPQEITTQLFAGESSRFINLADAGESGRAAKFGCEMCGKWKSGIKKHFNLICGLGALNFHWLSDGWLSKQTSHYIRSPWLTMINSITMYECIYLSYVRDFIQKSIFSQYAYNFNRSKWTLFLIKQFLRVVKYKKGVKLNKLISKGAW